MSAITHPELSPDVDRQEISAPPPAGPSHWKRLLILGVVLVAVLAIWQLWPAAEQAPAAPVVGVRTAPVIQGPIERVVRLSGSTTSVNFATVLTPRMQGDRSALILTDMDESGTRVAKGDVVATIDSEWLVNHISDTRANYRQTETNYSKLKAQQLADTENMKQDVSAAKAQVDDFLLESRAAPVRTPIDQQLLKLSLDEAQATYREKLEEMDFLKLSQGYDRRMQQYNIEDQKRHLDRHLRDLERYTVRAPVKGMVVRHTFFRNGQMSTVAPGDEVRPGRPLLSVMDTSEMQVEASINQAESEQVRIGLPARVGLDAFPNLTFRGRVYSIGAMAASAAGTDSDYVRRVPVRVRIEGDSPRLIPDLSAYADVILARQDDAVQVPLGAVFHDDGEPFVYVRNGDKYEKRMVKLGIENFTHAAVLEGIEVGDVVALDRPAS